MKYVLFGAYFFLSAAYLSTPFLIYFVIGLFIWWMIVSYNDAAQLLTAQRFMWILIVYGFFRHNIPFTVVQVLAYLFVLYRVHNISSYKSPDEKEGELTQGPADNNDRM